MSATLDIMNAMLLSIGETPVTRTDSGHPSARAALVTLLSEAEALMLHRWWFNMEYNVKLQRTSTHIIFLPSNTISVRLPHNSKLVVRGNRLYNPVGRTFEMDSDVIVDLQLNIDIDDLPPHAISYLKHRCIVRFFTDNDGDADRLKVYANDTLRAWALLRAEDLKQHKVNAHSKASVQTLLGGHLQPGSSYDPKYPGGRFR